MPIPLRVNANSRRLVPLLLAGVLLLLALVFFGRRLRDGGVPQPLLTDPELVECVRIRHGRLWFVTRTDESRKPLLQFADLADGDRHTVGELPYGEVQARAFPESTADFLFYFAHSPARGRGTGGGLVFPSPSEVHPSGVKRVSVPMPSPVPARADEQLLRIRLTDGKWDTVTPDVGGFSLDPESSDDPLVSLKRVVTPNAVYWVRPNGGRAIEVIKGNRIVKVETPANRDLMLSPLDGGAPRRLTTGLADVGGLSADDEGVCWTGQHAFSNETRCDLYVLRTDTATKPIVIAGFDPSAQPILFHSRCYWASGRDESDSESVPALWVAELRNGRVRAANYRLPLDDTGYQLSPALLIKQEGRLLLFLYYFNLKGQRALFVARFDPTRPVPFGKPVPVPRQLVGDQMFLDDGYLYCVSQVKQETFVTPLLDLLSSRTVSPTMTLGLYRMRLPE